MDQDDSSLDSLKACYLDQHPDARAWLPGDDEGAHLVRFLISFYPSFIHDTTHNRRIGPGLILT